MPDACRFEHYVLYPENIIRLQLFILRGVDIVIGIDEAGRGPVLGSLVYCAAFWPVSEHDDICKLG